MNAWSSPTPRPSDEALGRIGEGLRRARLHRGLTQRDVEALSGVPQSTISRIENGLRPTAKVTALAELVHVLGEIVIPASAAPVRRPGPQTDRPIARRSRG